jgi:hypothetical protein
VELLSQELLLEKEFQDRINVSQEIQQGIIDVLFDGNYSVFRFEKEVEYINGITSDFTITGENSQLYSTIECKRPDIGVTEYVRGIGQLFQYEYFFEQDITPRKFSNHRYISKEIFNTAFVIPSDFYKNTTLNIGKFKYPKTTKIIEVNLGTNNVREIDKKSLDELAEKNSNTISISPYYLRDNRIFEYYILLKYIEFWQVTNPNQDKLNRKVAENHLKQINTINNGNWRNAFISLSILGFIDSKNRLTYSGRKMCAFTLGEFTFNLYKNYINNYVDLIIDQLFDEQITKITMKNRQLVEKIRTAYAGKDILYLTESDSRYISSWLNIIRDDFGCIAYKSRSSERTLQYVPNTLNDKELLKRIEKATVGKKYLSIFNDLLMKGKFIN